MVVKMGTALGAHLAFAHMAMVDVLEDRQAETDPIGKETME